MVATRSTRNSLPKSKQLANTSSNSEKQLDPLKEDSVPTEDYSSTGNRDTSSAKDELEIRTDFFILDTNKSDPEELTREVTGVEVSESEVIVKPELPIIEDGNKTVVDAVSLTQHDDDGDNHTKQKIEEHQVQIQLELDEELELNEGKIELEKQIELPLETKTKKAKSKRKAKKKEKTSIEPPAVKEVSLETIKSLEKELFESASSDDEFEFKFLPSKYSKAKQTGTNEAAPEPAKAVEDQSQCFFVIDGVNNTEASQNTEKDNPSKQEKVKEKKKAKSKKEIL